MNKETDDDLLELVLSIEAAYKRAMKGMSLIRKELQREPIKKRGFIDIVEQTEGDIVNIHNYTNLTLEAIKRRMIG